ncbi:MAG TPA: cytochrome P450 [Chloroflexota bacterium]|nr:cytochrome P450 [Chloroflexota bacterium]
MIENPYPFYAALRAAGPVAYAKAHDLWVVSRYEACAAVLRDAATYQELDNAWLDRWHAGADSAMPANGPLAAPIDGHVAGHVGDDSARLTPREVMVNRAAILAQRETLGEPRLRALADELIGRCAATGQVEFVGQFARPLVTAAVGELFGLPAKPWLAFFDAWDECFRPSTDPRQRARQAFFDPWNSFSARRAAFRVGVANELTNRRASPRADVLGAIARLSDDHTPRSDRDIPQMVERFATSAVVSLADFLGSLVWLIVRDPALREELSADPSLLTGAIEESLRLEPPIPALFFQASVTTNLAGSRIPAGAKLIVLLASANRDERVFPDADHFDPRRRNAAAHLAFSLGPGSCCGTPLVRRLGRVALAALLSRLPGLRVRADSDLTHYEKRYNRGYRRLDLEFDPR